ncbi:neuropeptide FF receptor 1-like [Actinia tenebrosa]|uniref:Neuropeptide FF receptor 1-like n=1 Tax=Actinia tenebrosa TaxID=6105 RepID=A0A6P8GYM6_ACTTE|nr:neuropeptide FF receptor 1-like [Actinia tenebrosa]
MEYPSNVSLENNGSISSSGAAKSNPLGSAYDSITICLFTTIFVAGVVGNSFVISTILRWDDMKTPCNYLIMTIAIADIGVAVFAAPLRIIERFIGWPFGEAVCRLLVPLQDVFVCVSVVAHTCIALERYGAIVTPFKRRLSPRKMKFVIAGLWIGCYLTSGLPVAPLLSTVTRKSNVLCKVIFPSMVFRRVFKLYLVIVFIAAPLLIQTWAYCWIARCISKKTLISESRSGPQQRRNRLVKMLFTSLLVFDIFYLPRGILMLFYEFGDRSTFSPLIQYINLISLIIYYLKHIINPMILFAMSADFRAGFYAACTRGQFEIVHDTSIKRKPSKNLKMVRLNSRKKSQDQQNQPQTVQALLENIPKCENNVDNV